MNWIKNNKWTVLLLGILFMTFPLWSQVRGKIQGKVVDTQGNPLSQVQITIISQKTSAQNYKLTTDQNGSFVQVGIYPGQYQLKFEKTGYAPATKTVKVSIGEATRLSITMEKISEASKKNLSKADQLFVQGNNLYKKENYQEAVQKFKQAAELNPSQWRYHLNLGLAYKKMEKTDEAIQAFQKAVEFNPENFGCNKELAELLAKKKNYSEAKKYYQKAAEINPQNADVFYNLGVVLSNLRENEKAVQAFQKTIKLDEDYAEAYYQMGKIYIGENKTDDAIIHLEKFLQMAPDHPEAKTAQQLLQYLKKQR
ncbi:tetratricopeptide repeat protein [bacterium]|nr:tetratricopeptide repeat protein [bacterium]